jgi:Ca-activated chloride channel homolog
LSLSPVFILAKIRILKHLALGLGAIAAGLAALHAEPPKSPGAGGTKAAAYGLIIDNTVAMRSQLTAAIATGKAFVESNGPADEAFIVTFSNRDNTTLEQRFTTRRSALIDALENMYLQGGKANLLDAVYLSAESLTEHESANKTSQQEHALILITTGADEDSFYTIGQVLVFLHKKSVKVYVIGFPQALQPEGAAEAGARKLCQQLAGETGGRAYFPASLAEAKQAAGEILARIRTQQMAQQK